MPRVKPESAEAVRKRQSARTARELAAGRVRRGYFATPAEHESVTAHLRALRGRGATVASPEGVLPEFRT